MESPFLSITIKDSLGARAQSWTAAAGDARLFFSVGETVKELSPRDFHNFSGGARRNTNEVAASRVEFVYLSVHLPTIGQTLLYAMAFSLLFIASSQTPRRIPEKMNPISLRSIIVLLHYELMTSDPRYKDTALSSSSFADPRISESFLG